MAQLKSLSINGNPVADFIVEQGTSGDWTYRKWNSGIAECWGDSGGIAKIDKGWSSAEDRVFVSQDVIYAIYPSNLFIEQPKLQATLQFDTGGAGKACWLYTENLSELPSGTTIDLKVITGAFRLVRPTLSAQNIDYTVNWYAMGKWK